MTTTSKPMKWTLAEMQALPEWIAQRDTAAHLDKYLGRPDFDANNATIGNGFATIIVNGVEYRGNGNTRTLGSKTINPVTKAPYITLPAAVIGIQYTCSTFDEGQKVYKSFDDTASSKQAQDRLTSALKKCGIDVKSKMFLKGLGTTGIAIAFNALRGVKSNGSPWETEKMIAELKPEIVILDRLMAKHGIGSSKSLVTSAAFQAPVLLTMYEARRTPHMNVTEVVAFWDQVLTHRGVTTAANGLVTASPVLKAWSVPTKKLTDMKGKQSRLTWFDIGDMVLGIFRRRDKDEIKNVNSVSLDEYFPCFGSSPETIAKPVKGEKIKTKGKKKTGKVSHDARA